MAGDAAVTAVLVGAGLRGRFTYGGYARAHPERLRLRALAEPDPLRREVLADELALPESARFEDWRALLDRERVADVAIVATGDTLHVEPALCALERGYHVLLEKPIALEPGDCVRVVEAAERAGRLLQICHPLRYAPFYERVHQIVRSGRLGRITTIDLKENVAYWHMTHSYVRGKFRKRALAAPILLAKCCHDLDLLAWIADRPAQRVASFGALGHYRKEDAPPGAPPRCSDGCPVQAECPHDAVRFYAGPDESLARIWPWSDVSPDPSREARMRALETGPYGRCVYAADNDVLDHQIVALELADGLAATFTVHGLASRETRTVRISGSRGELRGVLQDGVIEVSRHGDFATERIELPASPIGHFGGDEGLLAHFTDAVRSGAEAELRVSGRVALESHLIGFAAEEARERGQVVAMHPFRARYTRQSPPQRRSGDERERGR